jgi:hypothetical protein
MPSTYEPIATTTLGSGVTNLTFSSIPSTYTDLILVCNGNTAAAANNYLQFNGDNGSNYSATRLSGDGSAASSARSTSATQILLDGFGYWTTGYNANKVIHIMNYANTTTNKTVLTRANNASIGTDAIVGLWRSTAAITSIRFNSDSTLQAGSTFTLYGIKAA